LHGGTSPDRLTGQKTDQRQEPNMKPEFIALARRSLLLASTPEHVAKSVLDSARVRSFSRSATIFLQGEQASAVYIVADGWVKLYRIAPSGTEAVVAVFTKGASFGEAVAFRHDSYPVSAEAVTDCTLIRIEADVFLSQIRENPEVAIAILSATFVHLHGLVAQVEALKAQTGAQRVAEFLLELASCPNGACEVTLPYDKVLIAGRLGMKPESLSRAFARLKDQGVTIRQNHAMIDDIGALRDYVEEDPALAWSKGGQ
jgi:CRP/FNR family transcriptional regulator, dissimilatory nitrate respiration regulator